MTIGKFQFIDSQQFMNTSLRKLIENLGAVPCDVKDCTKHNFRIDKSRCMGRPEAFVTLNKHIDDPLKVDLLLCKGVYPYEWVDSVEKFKVKYLPPITDFYSTLSGNISQEDYDHVKIYRN